MKIKDYFNSLVTRRKSSTSSTKVPKPKQESQSISSADCHYELCGYDDPTKLRTDDQHSRTQILLTRHAQLVNTIVGMRSPDISCPHCRPTHPSEQQQLDRKNYSNTLASCNPRRECQVQSTSISTSNHSLVTQTRQRSKIRTNPWIKTSRVSQPEDTIRDPTISSGLIHSESFPQTVLNGTHFLSTPSTRILHQSDSGHGLSSCSPDDNNSSDGPMLEAKEHLAHPNHQVKAIASNRVNKPKAMPALHPSNIRMSKLSPSSPRQSPFILPLEENNGKKTLTTLKKTDSRAILKHIEEIENEIQMIKNLNVDHTSEQFMPMALFSHENDRQAIHKQVDQWVEECLTTKNNDRLSNTIEDDDDDVRSSEVMTAFYLSSVPTTKRTFSFVDQPLLSSTKKDEVESIHECPF